MPLVVPNALALANIADGSTIVASDHRNNYAAVQVGVNGLIAVFDLATAKGDLLVATASGTYDRLPVGADGLAIVADSTQPKGIKYLAGVGGAIAVGNISATPTALAWPGGAALNCIVEVTAGGGTLQSIGAPTAGAGTRLSIRNFAAAFTVIDHTVAGNIWTRGVASFALATNETIDLMYDGVQWIEVGRDVATSATAELAYVEFTADKVATSSAEASALTVVSAGAVTYDGSTKVRVEFYCPAFSPSDSSNGGVLTLFDGTTATPLGQLWKTLAAVGAVSSLAGVYAVREFTPSAASHTYFVGITDAGAIVSNHATAHAGAGGAGTLMPGFIRISKAA